MHEFTGYADGGFGIPQGGNEVIVDKNGNLYGTTSDGGTVIGQTFPSGVVFEFQMVK